MNWIIELISGAVGGNIAGALLKKYSLGTIGNSIVGILGGGIGGWLLGMVGLGGGGGAGSAGGILSTVASGGVGGAVLMVIVGLIKQAMGKKA